MVLKLSVSIASSEKLIDLSELLKFGFITENLPLKVSELTEKLVSSLIPFPKKLFSLTPKPIDPPSVPSPAEALISPVGFSWIDIFIIFVLFFYYE